MSDWMGMSEMTGTVGDEGGASEVTFAQKLNKLLEVLAVENGAPMTAARFLEDFTSKTGAKLSPGYLSELRTGKVTAPRIDLVNQLAGYFKVQPGYFLPGADDAANQAKLDLLASMRANRVENLAIRASGLSDETLKRLAKIIENARELEDLPATPGGATLDDESS